MRYHFVNHHSLFLNLQFIDSIADRNTKVFCDGNFLRLVLRLLSIDVSYQPGPNFLELLIKKLSLKKNADILIIFANTHQYNIADSKLKFSYEAIVCDTVFTGDNSRLKDFIHEIKPKREIIICVGSPWQDIIAQRLSKCNKFEESNFYCIGAAMNFHLGIVKRNKYLAKYKLEWLNRLINEPAKTMPRIFITSIKVFWIAICSPKKIRYFFRTENK